MINQQLKPCLHFDPMFKLFRAIQWTKNKRTCVERQIHLTCYGSWIRQISIHDPVNPVEHQQVDLLGQEGLVQVVQRETIAHRVKRTIQ